MSNAESNREVTHMLWRRRRRALPARPDGAPLRDGDTVPYEGFRTNTEAVTAEQWRLPAWAAGPTEILPPVRHRPRVPGYVHDHQ